MPKRSRRPKDRQPGDVDPAAALALVATAIPLPKAIAKALRLTCRSTKLAVDQTIKELNLSQKAFKNLRVSDTNPLTTGLMAVLFHGPEDRACNARSFVNACTAARINAESLEHLVLPNFIGDYLDGNAFMALNALGGLQWPRLRSLTLWHIPDGFESMFKNNSMPELTELHLHGALGPRDIAALAAGQRFSSTVEILDIRISNILNPDENAETYYTSMKQMLQRASKLRQLTLTAVSCPDLGFLDGAQLAALEELTLEDLPGGVSLAPIASLPKARLQKLKISGDEENAAAVNPADLALVFSSPFPVLDTLRLDLKCTDMGFLREISAPELERLSLLGWTATEANAAAIGMALDRLPKLTALALYPEDGSNGAASAYRLTESLLEGRTLHRCLRHFETGGAWTDDDESLENIAFHSENFPALEEIVLTKGRITRRGFNTFADYTSRLRGLRVLLIHSVQDVPADDSGDEWERNGIFEDEQKLDWCADIIEEAWPEAVLEVLHNKVVE